MGRISVASLCACEGVRTAYLHQPFNRRASSSQPYARSVQTNKQKQFCRYVVVLFYLFFRRVSQNVSIVNNKGVAGLNCHFLFCLVKQVCFYPIHSPPPAEVLPAVATIICTLEGCTSRSNM